jgi:polar amino acid transport system substrate-binding protein
LDFGTVSYILSPILDSFCRALGDCDNTGVDRATYVSAERIGGVRTPKIRRPTGMKNIWKALLLVALIASLSVVTGCGEGDGADEGATAETEEFVFANSGAYKPFSFDDGGEIVGFDVDIANEIASRIDRTPVMKSPVPFDSLIEGLKSGRYDALVASHGITAEREEQVDFSMPYYRSGAQIFIGADTTDISGPDDLEGKKIGVVKASTYLDLANTLTDEGNVSTYDSDVIALQDLEARNESGLDIETAGDVLSSDEMGMAVQEGDTELLDAINSALEDMIADGTYEEISMRWFDENILGE